MLRLSEIKLLLDHNDKELPEAIIRKLGIKEEDLISFSVFRRSYDARKKSSITLVYHLDVVLIKEVEDEVLEKLSKSNFVKQSPDMSYHLPAQASTDFPTKEQQRPIVVGFGPSGIFATLLLAQMGLKPIVLERGQDVKQRTKDTFGFWRKRKLNPESNVQFGEGGAGTFSDGKLHTQIKDKRFLGRKVLNEFVAAGAPDEILWMSKPHIGTFKLVSMVKHMRAEIIRLGGEVRFEQKVEAITREVNDDESGQITGVTLSNGESLYSRHVVLAVGHSARDTFQMLHDSGVYIEAKPFSIGLRIEHPQSLVDLARFGNKAGHPILGAADYKLVHHCKNGRDVYSFCMCPGGSVVAATSEEGHLVTNGMSEYARNGRNANAGIVVGITPEKDFSEGPLAGIHLQQKLEKLAFELGGSDYNAPAQLVGDFLKGKASTELGSVEPSYLPGVKLGDLSELLPKYVTDAIREAIPVFAKQIKGFAMNDAVLTGIESRTSSPIFIKREKDFQSINTRGLYPAGEGAGYAGGILSAAVDGVKIAEAIAKDILLTE